ncbi:MAG: aquaporin family protein [Gemmatimonadetes bacterium]|nr:aquaporin family protein [Gemmatimonadota bacterium]
MDAELGRRLTAEAIGTALLVIFGAGSVVAALTLGGGELDFAGLGMVALSFGLVIAVVIYAFGTTSGAHINPAVTLSLAVTGRFPWREVLPYITAQLAGAVAGGLLIIAAFGTDAADLGGAGSTTLADGVSYGSGIVAEALATFLLVSAIMALAVDRRAPGGWAGLIIGLSVTCAIIVMGPFTGASLNPARTFGPYLVTSLFGGDTPWSEFPLYWIGPVIGGAAAAFTYDLVARPDRAEPVATDAQGTQGEIEGRRGGAEETATETQGTQGEVIGRRR